MTILFCNACGSAVEENADGEYEALDGSACTKNRGVHRVEQIIPDPPEGGR